MVNPALHFFFLTSFRHKVNLKCAMRHEVDESLITSGGGRKILILLPHLAMFTKCTKLAQRVRGGRRGRWKSRMID